MSTDSSVENGSYDHGHFCHILSTHSSSKNLFPVLGVRVPNSLEISNPERCLPETCHRNVMDSSELLKGSNCSGPQGRVELLAEE